RCTNTSDYIGCCEVASWPDFLKPFSKPMGDLIQRCIPNVFNYHTSQINLVDLKKAVTDLRQTV
ncbi:MAG: hypothetical protein AAB874_07280, partial [Patescibacteria group bacterium]